MKDAFIRGVRTFVQAFLGVFLGMTITGDAYGVPSFDVLKTTAIAAGWAGVVAVLAFTQNAIEDITGRAALK